MTMSDAFRAQLVVTVSAFSQLAVALGPDEAVLMAAYGELVARLLARRTADPELEDIIAAWLATVRERETFHRDRRAAHELAIAVEEARGAVKH